MKRKRIIVSSVAAVIFIGIVIGAAWLINNDMSKSRMVVDLYFLNTDGTGIVAEPHEIKFRNEVELAENTIMKLISAPSDSHKERVIPKGVNVNRIEIYDNDSMIIDFSAEFLTDDAARNMLETYAVVKTMCSTGLVSTVEVMVEGSPVSDRDGKELGFISASDINLENEEYSSEMRNIILYFTDKAENGLIREERRVKITDQQPIEQYIINELIKGTRSKSYQSLLSGKTVLMSVDIEDNICYLNFKSGFIKDNSGSSTHEQLVIYSIVNSLTELESISRVQFYMDGKRVNSFGSVPIWDCFARDTSLIQGE